MSRTDLAHMSCTLARTVEIVGDNWTLMILRELFLGTRRFDAMQKNTGASSATVSARLKRLQNEGLITSRLYSERPARVEYLLTASGIDLWPVIIALKNWGDRWATDGQTNPTPVSLHHKTCGKATVPNFVCSECHEPIHARSVTALLSPQMLQERNSRTNI